ncbi:MAG TPA: TIM barrel protein [Cyclobacteriaceae bacterium]|nr:TIM barrel protein [Cyclobacteriaceae bacterium]
MQSTRRTFLKSAVALAGATVLTGPSSLFAMKSKNELTGIQLYSVRAEMKADPLGTLKQLAAMGYRHVEHANYVDRKFYGWTAKEFRKILDDLGMTMPSGHTVMRWDHWDDAKKDFTDAWKYTVEDAAVMGQRYVISPSMDQRIRRSLDDLKQFMDIYNKSGELCNKSGMQFGYHNHHFEFAEKFGDETLYDLILKHTDPKLVMQQLDVGNMFNAGAKAIEIINKYPGRFPSMHVKDMVKGEEDEHNPYDSTILGTGVIPVKEIMDAGRKKGGTIHFIVEQEAYQGKSPLDCMKENLDVMKKWKYA